ncbi:chromate efflux transporter [soil metagenome]
MADRARLIEVDKLFTKLGFTAFGGPAVHAGMMEDEVVHRRKWIDRQHFLDLMAAVNFIPGPNSTELAIHIGLIRAGLPGLVVAGVCFITPAVLIILPLAWLYTTYQQLPAVGGVLRGISAVVIAVIAVAMLRLFKTALSNPIYIAIAVITVIAGYCLRGVTVVPIELVLLGVAAFTGWFAQSRSHKAALPLIALSLLPLAQDASSPLAVSQRSPSSQRETGSKKTRWFDGMSKMLAFPFLAMPAMSTTTAGLLTMTLAFLRIGATLFGSGYLLVPYLQAGLVDRAHLLTQQQMQDSIAVGQVTPGPLLTTATFAGYVVGHTTLHGGNALGVIGALLATVAIFAPSFVLVALLGKYHPAVRNLPGARGALDGMNAAVVAMILLVLIKLAAASLHDAWSIGLAVVGAVLMLAWNVNSTWLIAGAGLVGWLVYR